jgi:hypothetical protein
MASLADKSRGHIAFAGRWEYFSLPGGDIARADARSPMRCDVPYRNGARFVGTAAWAKDWLNNELRAVAP